VADQKKPVLCLTFDNMGEAHNVFLGKSAVPDLKSPAITVGFPNILGLLAKYDLRATFLSKAGALFTMATSLTRYWVVGTKLACTDGFTKSSPICPS
jgi:hypothetical protein